jgi:replicative DNA helicase
VRTAGPKTPPRSEGPTKHASAVTDAAERGLLACLLRCPGEVDEVRAVTCPEHCRRADTRYLFEAILAVYDRGETRLDVAAVVEQLSFAGKLEDVGGTRGVGDILMLEATGGRALYHAERVRDGFMRRSFGSLGGEMMQESLSPTGPATESLAKFEGDLLNLSMLGAAGRVRPIGDVVDEVFAGIDRRAEGAEVSGVPTGWGDIDQLLAGMHDGELILIGARPAVGKTAFACGIARHVAVKLRAGVLFVSLEQKASEIVERILCSQASVDSHRVRTGRITPAEAERLSDAGDAVRRSGLFIDDVACQSVARIAASARRLKRTQNLRCVLVDYLQLVQPESRKGDRREQVDDISRRLKLLARDLCLPVVALAQLRRDSDGREPRLSDFREAGGQEQDADVAVLLHRPEEPKEGQEQVLVDAIVAKQRNGPTGRATLCYQRNFVRFDNYAPEVPGWGA